MIMMMMMMMMLLMIYYIDGRARRIELCGILKIHIEVCPPPRKSAVKSRCLLQSNAVEEIQGDSKLLSGFPWPIIFKSEIK
jgi:hypothetical protein